MRDDYRVDTFLGDLNVYLVSTPVEKTACRTRRF